ncbi:hypothetical protein ACT3TB_10965 [Micrococcaceae sp. AOP34-BR2-30]
MDDKLNALKDSELKRVQVFVWVWCALLVALPIVAVFAGGLSMFSILPLVMLGVPSAGLLLAAWAVLPRVGRKPLRLGETAAAQERQLKHIRTLAGVQGGIGLAIIATIGLFDPGPLEYDLLTASVFWAATAVVYFVAFWGMARLERE